MGGISKIAFDIPLKILYSNIERCTLYCDVKIKVFLDLSPYKRFEHPS